MKALILAAGYATRLYPLTLNTPKQLLKVDGKYVIDYIIEKLKDAGINEIIVVSNDKFYSQFEKWNPGVKLLNDGSKNEDDRLEAIGDINFVLNELNVEEDVLILAGDNLFTFDLKKFLEFAKDKPCTIVGRNLLTLKEASKHGNLEMDETGKITSFIEKPPEPKTKLTAICVYYWKKEILKLFQQYLQESTGRVAQGFFMEWLTKKTDVYAWINDEPYFDIGDKEKLKEAERWMNEHNH